jgi:hypothetical protein
VYIKNPPGSITGCKKVSNRCRVLSECRVDVQIRF